MINTKTSAGRREFLRAVGAGVASSAIIAQTGNAQVQDKSVQPLKVIDFHNHYVGPSFALTTIDNTPRLAGEPSSS